MLDHLSIQCTDVAASAVFYDKVLAPLGGTRVLDFGTAVGFGVPPMPDFWIGPQTTGAGFREAHIAFAAADHVFESLLGSQSHGDSADAQSGQGR